jgi:hypothetical protein
MVAFADKCGNVLFFYKKHRSQRTKQHVHVTKWVSSVAIRFLFTDGWIVR